MGKISKSYGEWYIDSTDSGNIHGVMQCKACKKELSGDYLTRYVSASARGNEDDYIENICRKCSSNNKIWAELDKERSTPVTIAEDTAESIIRDLVATINWLGGDSYEMEAIEPVMDRAENFVSKNYTRA